MADYPSPWPNDLECAVSLTFDDGTPNQLREGVPRLDDLGLRGTWYVPIRGEGWQERLAPWQAVMAAGHELGNHSTSHICSENFQDRRPPRGLESLTLDEIRDDILGAEQILNEQFGPVSHRSFAYPCYMTHVGRGLHRQSYVPVIAEHFVAGRGGGEYGFHNHPYHADLACLAGLTCQGMMGTEMVGLVERAARQRRWAILVFHGVDQGWLSTAGYALDELLKHLVDNQHRLWIAPVAEVAAHLVTARAALPSLPETGGA